MPTTLPALTGPTLDIRAWPDELVDRLGHDPRSPYVERFWLGVLGPSTIWLLRRFAHELDRDPDGFRISLAETAQALGLGGTGVSSPFVRALRRCCQFDMARGDGPGVLAVRRKLPPLSRRHLLRLPADLQSEHQAWVDATLRPNGDEGEHRRAARLALSLLELGDDPPATEVQLARWGFAPAVAHLATGWATARHAQRIHHSGGDAPTAA